MEWIVLPERAPIIGRSMYAHLRALQSRWLEGRTGCLWGIGVGCLDAIWLASMYDAQLLCLQGWRGMDAEPRMGRLCERSLFSVICPVLFIEPQTETLPAFANACVYRAESKAECDRAAERIIKSGGKSAHI